MSTAVTGLTALALLTATVVLTGSGSWRAALGVLMELLVAAGLLRLSTARTWTAVGAAATVVTVRLVLATVLRATTGPSERATTGRPERAAGAPAWPAPPDRVPASPDGEGDSGLK